MQAQNIFHIIEAVAPRELQESYDNAGLQCGNPHSEVSRVLTCLDVTEEVVEEAHQRGCQLIVSHHPLLFRGTRCIDPTRDYISRVLWSAIRYGIGLYASHTNLDKASGGLNYWLASVLGLTAVQPLSECGVMGQLPQPMTAAQLLAHISSCLGDARLRYNRDAKATADSSPMLRTLALCSGSGSDFIAEAEALNADAYLTGEMHYHSWFGHPDILLIEAGHFETEQMAPELLNKIITDGCPDVECMTSQHNQSPTSWF